MTFGDLYDYCRSRPGAVEEFPFGPQALVFKVAGKMFALLSMDARPPTLSLKCDPERAVELRSMYEAVQPGYHMNKRHWNTIIADGTLSRSELVALIDHSYDLVVRGLSAAARHSLDS